MTIELGREQYIIEATAKNFPPHRRIVGLTHDERGTLMHYPSFDAARDALKREVGPVHKRPIAQWQMDDDALIARFVGRCLTYTISTITYDDLN